MFNGKVEYLAFNCHNRNKSYAYSEPPHTEIFKFAESVVNVLKSNCPAAIVNGMVRVDIFRRKDGKFVVNEFESFEADFYPGGSSTNADILKCNLISKMERNYENLLEKYIDRIYFK